MATIDDKVVAMSFESSKFERGVNSTISALDKLKAALHFPDAGKGLDNINKSAKKVDLGHIANGVDAIKSKLGALSVAALAVFAQIAQRAVASASKFIKAFTLDPVIGGLREYETKLNSVQTILANTQAAGTTLKDVNRTLAELNEYSDKTIYNFGQMAKNIGTFTAAGVELDVATGAIKGIANLAALSGSNAEQAATAMYQLSQAISAGRVNLQDWNSVVNAGMGGTVFQRALAQTAEAMGTLKKGTVDLVGPMKNVTVNGESFRQSLQVRPGEKSWLTSDVLTATLGQFTGDLKDAELAAMGFNDAQIKSIQQTAKTAMFAATEVKTLSQALSVAKETAESGWAETWQIVFGDFAEAKRTFTDLSNAINGFINANADARNKVLADWKKLGGRTVLIQGIKTAFQALGQIVKPIRDAFRDIFPPTTGKDLYNLTVRFKEFTEALKPSPATVENLRRTFRGFFALLSIGKQIIAGIFTVFKELFGALDGAGGSFLNITGNIGDFLVSIDQALKKGNRLNKFFQGIGEALSVPLQFLKELASAIANLFGGFSSGGFSAQINGMTEAMTPFQAVMEGLSDVWDKFLDSVGETGKVLQPAFDAIIELIQGLGPAISTAISSMNFEAILAVIRTGLLGGLFLIFKNFFGKGGVLKEFGGGILGNISGSFDALQGSLKALQTNIKAKTMKEIAIAVALLAASIVALSFVDPKRLESSMAAITIAFGQLLGAMAILEKISTATGFLKLPFITASLILLAGAINVLTIAVLALSLLSWEKLAKGLGGVAVLLTGITIASGPLSANSAGMIRAGVGITALAIALNLLAIAVKVFATMSWSEIAKGLGGVAFGLEIIAVSMQLMPKNMLLTGAGLILVAAGLRILANVVGAFGDMNWTTIGKGMAGIGGALVIIAGAMRLMPPNMVLTAAGLLLVSLALGRIADAVESMGGMSVREMAKGLIALALSLGILAAALILMQGSIGGAVALGIAAAGLAILTPALIALGRQKWSQIIKGLVALAAALALIGIAATLLTPAIPAMIGLGAALVLIGAGLALAGAGIALIGIGLSAIAVAAPTAAGVIVQAFVQLHEGLIKNAKLLILGLLEVVEAFAATAPKFVDAMVKIIGAVLDAIIRLAPKMGEAFEALLTVALGVLRRNQGKIIQAGFDLLLALLRGIKNNIGRVVVAVVDIVVRFLSALSSQLGRITTAGVNLLTSFIKGIINNLSKVAGASIEIIASFLSTIAKNIGKIITAGASIIVNFIKGISNNIQKVVSAAADLMANFIRGIANAGQKVIAAGTNAAAKLINGLVTGILKLVNVGAQAIIRFLNGVADAIDRYEPQMIAAGLRIGKAIVTGMIRGLAQSAPELLSAAGKLVDDLKNRALKKLKIKSPSEIFEEIGQNIVLGLAAGMSDTSGAQAAAEQMSQSVIDMTNEVFQTASPSRVMAQIGQYVGQGFAQGIRGSADDIKRAFTELNNKLTEAMSTARQTIASEQNKIDAERREKKPDKAEIREAQQVIAQNQALLAKSRAGHIALTKALKDEKAELLGLAADYIKVSDKLKEATDVLEEAKRTRDQAFGRFADQYGITPDLLREITETIGEAEVTRPLTGAEQLAAYQGALQAQASAVSSYHATLQELRRLGLDDKTYQKLVEEGTADAEFANALLAGGKTAVAGLNKLDAQLMAESTKLATSASKNLYQAGVDAAQGVVDGLASKQAAIEKQMNVLARAMVRAIKKALRIKSPSEVFAEVGKFSAEGMANGLTDSSKLVTDAAEKVALDAAEAMRATLSDIPFDDLMDTDPVITPVLDLTAIRAGADQMASMIPTTPTVGLASFGQASVISSEQAAAQAEQIAVAPGGTAIRFEQNNYSPEALKSIEIYRQTKNQLSQLKSVLALT